MTLQLYNYPSGDKLLISIIIITLYISFVLPRHAFAATKRIEINLTNQQLYAFEDEKLIYQFPVSTGKWAPTPTGDFKPWARLKTTRMRGGNPKLDTYYDLPNVPHTIYFHGNYGIHGAYWHNNFGVPMSHGCVNVAPTNMEKVYNWSDMDTLIRIYGITPKV